MNRRAVKYGIGAIIFVVIVIFFIDIIYSKPSTTFEIETDITSPTVSSTDAIYGNKAATNTIVHFGFIGCDACKDMQETLREIVDEDPNVRLVWKDFPNTTMSPNSLTAAIAARCAQEQDAFWEYQPYLFGNENRLDEEFYISISEELELKQRKFERCLDKGSGAELVQASIEEGEALSITVSPTLYINGTRYAGQMSAFEIKQLLLQ